MDYVEADHRYYKIWVLIGKTRETHRNKGEQSQEAMMKTSPYARQMGSATGYSNEVVFVRAPTYGEMLSKC